MTLCRLYNLLKIKELEFRETLLLVGGVRGLASAWRVCPGAWCARHRVVETNQVKYAFGGDFGNPLSHLALSLIPHPPAKAPMIRNGSEPEATASGNGASGDSWDTSSRQAKNRTKGRRWCVRWSRSVPHSTG